VFLTFPGSEPGNLYTIGTEDILLRVSKNTQISRETEQELSLRLAAMPNMPFAIDNFC
jgi:hypothetical protein